MGNWIITIEGTGSHHNGKPEDADQIALVAVKTLQNAGQSVEHATITTGGRSTLLAWGPVASLQQPLRPLTSS